jgi:hypothetical protein
MADRLTLTKAFEDAGIERAKAEHVANAVYDAIHDQVATKADMQLLQQEVRSQAAMVNGHIETSSSALKSDLQIAIRDVKLWTGKLATGAIAIMIAVITAAIRFVGHG